MSTYFLVVAAPSSKAEPLTTQQKKKWALQIPQLKKKLQSQPKDLKSRELLGKAYFHTGDFSSAIEMLNEDKLKKDKENFNILALSYEGAKDYLEAIRILEILKTKYPKEHLIYIDLARNYLLTRKHSEAVTNLREALKIQPQSKKAFEGLVAAFEDQKNYYEARVVLLDMTNTVGPTIYSLTKLCNYYTLDSFFENSLSFCKSAIEKDPMIAENHINLAITYQRTQNEKQAQQIIETTARRFKNSEVAQWMGGQSSDSKKNWELSTRYYTACTQADKKSARCFQGLGQAHFNLKNYKESLVNYESSCKLDRTIRTEIAKQASTLRIQGNDTWYEKFNNLELNCGR